MLVTIHNEALTVQIEDAGAQLASIRDTRGVEYLWQGDPAIWNRRAPLLFPFIARLKDEQYLLDGKPYHMGIHGFCRTAPFTVEAQSETSVTFRYADTAETRESYPFSLCFASLTRWRAIRSSRPIGWRIAAISRCSTSWAGTTATARPSRRGSAWAITRSASPAWTR